MDDLRSRRASSWGGEDRGWFTCKANRQTRSSTNLLKSLMESPSCAKSNFVSSGPACVRADYTAWKDVVAEVDSASGHGTPRRGEMKTAIDLPTKVHIQKKGSCYLGMEPPNQRLEFLETGRGLLKAVTIVKLRVV
ncbi:hypothetical protein CRG98_044733 [Punica granatum]|uniref:Uncharacterized protein n=1 Tax=Punica granatum TaxID=22663 RepID=A0A2I0HT56_PUNGR|nr:hypothetical protein CRG98_044733 [Punica granatum]